MDPTVTLPCSEPRWSRRWLIALGALLVPTATLASEEPAKLQYNRDIRPILSENCFACHGPDSASRKADLRLDQREAAINAKAIAPGDADSSELIFRIEADDPEVAMPPPGGRHKALTAEQKAILKRWIAEGAEYQPHWSFIAPQRPMPPQVATEGWVRTPIDRFVLQGLEQAGLTPAPEADRRTLARRVSLDLTGLPPTPEEVEAFVADQAANAYERYVDQLLESPRWGEHRARAWLDAARYADTHGLHFDNYREMWSYRDWVIQAFNANLPFNQFSIEQIAGDLLANPTLKQRIASGFNRCNITTNEGGTIAEENLVNYTKDRTETFSQVWLGLTANCAACHDHKFDPLSQREYYELSAFFNNTTQSAFDGNVKDTAPIAFVPPPQDEERWNALITEVDTARKAVESRREAARAGFDGWLGTQSFDSLTAMIPTEGQRFRAQLGDRLAPGVPTVVKGSSPLESAELGDFERDQPFTIAAWVKPSKGDMVGSIVSRMADKDGFRGWDLWLDNGRIGTHLVHKWPEDAFKVITNDGIPADVWTHVTLSYDGSGKPEGVAIYFNGDRKAVSIPTNALKSTIRTSVPFKVGQRDSTDRVEGLAIQDLRLLGKGLSQEQAEQLAGGARALSLVAVAADQRPADEVNALFDWWLRTQDAPTKELRTNLARLEAEQAAIKARGTVAHVTEEKAEPAMAFILYRGDYDKRKDQVQAETPDILPPFPSDLPRNRLGLAQWLFTPEHPLTARVAVNRYWQEVFGTGLVRSAGDFGVSGELPSHPELLDWLALEFRDSGWDVKGLFRLIVTSAAYRQAAAAPAESWEKDPQNRLLSRGPRFRMDAEMVRDYALAASGLLADRVGGPSVRPYQPEGVWEAVAMPESNTKRYQRDGGDSLYRRSLYTFWKRAAPPASLEVFNAPSREFCTVRRERTNTPLQALVTLNDPQFIEAARGLATLTLQKGGTDDEARIRFMAARILARPLRAEELAPVTESFQALRTFFQEHPDRAAELLTVGELPVEKSIEPAALAAWTMLGNELLNLDEALNK